MSIIVISDLHLNPAEPQGLAALATLRQKWAANCSDLYILGDFFEAWVGDDDNNTFIEATVAELQTWRKLGVKLYFMRGNRDFLLSKDFAKRVDWNELSDPYAVDFYGIPVLLSHGDLLCSDDLAYQRWRHYANSPWLQRLFLALPLWLRRKIAQSARQKSKNYVETVNSVKMDIVTDAALAWLKQAHRNMLVHGHTHKPGYHLCYRENQAFTRITLSDWHNGFHALIWEKDGYYFTF
ncbi:MAG: lpxH [Gammaproteobacteria bacterium]|jgi:UDP-2,3-diacylglucosamine hydrolase|nr:lpxH [Gammaproteobacteria bacterium]